jgi:site-specific DNA-adenine methylase
MPKPSAARPVTKSRQSTQQRRDSSQPSPPKQTNNEIIVPSEPFYGGKTRLGRYILPHSPMCTGLKCIDLCGGLGNLTWQAKKIGLDFVEWVINDPLQLPFYEAVKAIGHKIKVPPRSREEFERQRELAETGDQRAIALAPWLSYNGGGYGNAFSSDFTASAQGNGHRTAGGRRTPESEERNLRLMHRFLNEKNIRLSGLDWRDCLEKEKPGPRDLILIDGPYLDCRTAAYEPGTFIPIEVIDYLNTHPKLNWLFCEYRQAIYEYAFGPPVFQKEVQLRSINFAKAKQEKRIECVWTSKSYNAHFAKTGSKTFPSIVCNASQHFRR